MNVAAGGQLYVDIPSQVNGSLIHEPPKGRLFISHPVNLAANCKLRQIYESDTILVNSNHHQAVSEPGDGIKISAMTSDGVIEGIEDENLPFFIGVQWHPERMEGNQAGINRIFETFILAALDTLH